MSQIKGKQVQPASTTASGVITAGAQSLFGQKTFDSVAAQTVQVITLKNAVGEAPSFLTTASPEGVVTSPVGGTATDVTNGSTYLKAAGTGNTGWVELSKLYRTTAANLATAPNTEGVQTWTTDTDLLYSGTGAGKQLLSTPIFNTAGRVAVPRIWIGSATSAAGTGIFSLNYSSAGFTVIPQVFVTCQTAGTATTNTQPFSNVTARTLTTASGRVVQGRNATVGASTLAFAGAITVNALVVGT